MNFSEPDTGVKKTRLRKERDIARAAARLFSQYGYAGTTTMAIAKEAGVAEKTLFKYFHTKQELYDKTVYPLMKRMIREKVEGYAAKDGGIRDLLRDLYRDKLRLTNENPDMLKLTIHEFLMNRAFRDQLGEIWTASYLPNIVAQLELPEETRRKYGPALTRAIVALLLAYAVDKTYIRPDENFDDEMEISLMLELLFNGMNGLRNQDGRENV